MSNSERYRFISADTTLGEAAFRPYLPISLNYQNNLVNIFGLLDTGATINVLPYSIGMQLGYIWEDQTTALNLTGNLARYEARAIVVDGTIGNFDPVKLVFAWTRNNEVPLILGQVNFFMEFNVCFYRSQLYFEVIPKTISL
ncbi:MAG: hypothetical protein AB4372_24665 [Xenococcus sp. (in: cyanobacteria)]